MKQARTELPVLAWTITQFWAPGLGDYCSVIHNESNLGVLSGSYNSSKWSCKPAKHFRIRLVWKYNYLSNYYVRQQRALEISSNFLLQRWWWYPGFNVFSITAIKDYRRSINRVSLFSQMYAGILLYFCCFIYLTGRTRSSVHTGMCS